MYVRSNVKCDSTKILQEKKSGYKSYILFKKCLGGEVLEGLKARVGLDGHFSEWRKVSGGILMDCFY